MKSLIKSLLPVLFVSSVVGALMVSCAEESDCSTAGRPMLRGIFYGISNESGMDRAVKDTVDWLTVRFFETDSVTINAQENVEYVDLPLRYTADSTVMVFQYNKDDLTQADTIIFRHENTPFFISVDCGYEVKQKLTGTPTYTRHYLDSINVRNQETNVIGTENLRFFLMSAD